MGRSPPTKRVSQRGVRTEFFDSRPLASMSGLADLSFLTVFWCFFWFGRTNNFYYCYLRLFLFRGKKLEKKDDLDACFATLWERQKREVANKVRHQDILQSTCICQSCRNLQLWQVFHECRDAFKMLADAAIQTFIGHHGHPRMPRIFLQNLYFSSGVVPRRWFDQRVFPDFYPRTEACVWPNRKWSSYIAALRKLVVRNRFRTRSLRMCWEAEFKWELKWKTCFVFISYGFTILSCDFHDLETASKSQRWEKHQNF